jgi:hypothetical protein
MSATRCLCIGEFFVGSWLVLVPDEECLAIHPATAA